MGVWGQVCGIGMCLCPSVYRAEIPLSWADLCVPVGSGCAVAGGMGCCSCRVHSFGLGTSALSGSAAISWGLFACGCALICKSLCVWISVPCSLSTPSGALNATLVPECAEECCGQGESARPGRLACSLWKITGASQNLGKLNPAGLEPGAEAFTAFNSSHSLFAGLGTYRDGSCCAENPAFLPPLPRCLARARAPRQDHQHPWGRVRRWDYFFSEVLPRPDILFIL